MKMRRSDAASSILCFKRGSFVVLSVCVLDVHIHTHTRTRTHAYTQDWGNSPVCPPFVILSEANHVRQRVALSVHAENRRGGNADSKPGVLWKYCFVHARTPRRWVSLTLSARVSGRLEYPLVFDVSTKFTVQFRPKTILFGTSKDHHTRMSYCNEVILLHCRYR